MKSSAQNAETRLTLTLVCIVVMFLLLVAPSELINLYFYVVYSIIIIIIIINENISVAFSPKTARTRVHPSYQQDPILRWFRISNRPAYLQVAQG